MRASKRITKSKAVHSPAMRDMSQTNSPVGQPNDREKAISAAFLRHVGATQVDAASAAGVDRRTLQRWEQSSWWPDVQRDAADRWLSGLAAQCRRGLEAAVEDDGRLALSVLERLEPALAPARHRVALSHDVDLDLLSDEQRARIAAGEQPSDVIPSR